jgi:hypothetical protein
MVPPESSSTATTITEARCSRRRISPAGQNSNQRSHNTLHCRKATGHPNRPSGRSTVGPQPAHDRKSVACTSTPVNFVNADRPFDPHRTIGTCLSCSVLPIRNQVVACPVWTLAGVRPLVVHPARRVDLPPQWHWFWPSPRRTHTRALRRARHGARAAQPRRLRGRPHRATSALSTGIQVAAHRDRPRSTRNGLALTVIGAHSHTRTTLPQHHPAKYRHHGLRGCARAGHQKRPRRAPGKSHRCTRRQSPTRLDAPIRVKGQAAVSQCR